MNDENTPRDCSRSATIVFRLLTEILPISCKASYADFAYAARVSLRTPHTSRSGFPRGEASRHVCTTGLNLSIFRFPPHGRPSSRGQLSLPDVNYTKFTGLKSQLETPRLCPSSIVLYPILCSVACDTVSPVCSAPRRQRRGDPAVCGVG